MRVGKIFSSLLAAVQAIMDPGDFLEDYLPEQEDGKPLVLDNIMLERAQKRGNVLVMFHAPWCSHCTALEPEFAKASLLVTDAKLIATFATYDGVQKTESELKEMGLTGFPTVRWYTSHGDYFDFSGPRKSGVMAHWVKFMKMDPITDMVQLPTPSSLANSNKKEKVCVTLVGKERTEAFERIALTFRTEAKFAFVEDTSGMQESRIVVHRPNEEAKEMYDISDKEAIKSFFLRERLPTFGEMSRESWANYKAQGRIGLVYVLFDHTDENNLTALVEQKRNAVSKLAKKWWEKFAFVYVDTTKHAETLQSWFNIQDFPCVIVTNLTHEQTSGDNKRYVLPGDFDPEQVNEFLIGIDDGSTKPNFKSEPVPTEQPDTVLKVVGKTLLSEVFRPDRDFFLEVHAPWCVHCHSLQPQVDEVAKSFLDVGAQDIIGVGRLNGQANDAPSKLIKWEHFPTLLFVPAGSDKPILFDRDRNTTSMLEFIAENTNQRTLQKAICQILITSILNISNEDLTHSFKADLRALPGPIGTSYRYKTEL